MYKARKEQSSKSYSRKLSQILMKKGRFSGLKPLYLLNHSIWLYTCHTFSESCVTREYRGIEKMMLGVDSKPLGILSSLRTQTGPWSDTASYWAQIRETYWSLSPDGLRAFLDGEIALNLGLVDSVNGNPSEESANNKRPHRVPGMCLF